MSFSDGAKKKVSLIHTRPFRKFWPPGYKTVFIFNSADHEIFHANKSQITNNAKFFLAKHN